MVEFIGSQARSLPDEMTLSVERKIHDKTWRFILRIRQVCWEDLFGWNAPDRPGLREQPAKTAWEAYRHEQAFWDSLAERNADSLAEGATRDSPSRHREAVVRNLEWLEVEYHRHKTASMA